MTVGDDTHNVNPISDPFEKGCQEQWESTDQHVVRGDPLLTLNWIITCVGKKVLSKGV